MNTINANGGKSGYHPNLIEDDLFKKCEKKAITNIDQIDDATKKRSDK